LRRTQDVTRAQRAANGEAPAPTEVGLLAGGKTARRAGLETSGDDGLMHSGIIITSCKFRDRERKRERQRNEGAPTFFACARTPATTDRVSYGKRVRNENKCRDTAEFSARVIVTKCGQVSVTAVLFLSASSQHVSMSQACVCSVPTHRLLSNLTVSPKRFCV
jgi:hypothetical protein